MSAPPLKKLGVAFIKRVIEETKGCSPIPYREHLKHTIGNVNVDRISPELLDSTVIEFNPQGRPSMIDAGLDLESGRTKVPAYSTLNITIDGQTYAIDSMQ